jgi:hypothetical protein
LAEEVVISGRKCAGTKARVYDLLRQTAERSERHRIGSLIGPAGWVPNYYIRRAWSGGNAGDRRLRDLREKFGVRIERMPFSEDSSVVLYRWAGDPEPDRVSDQVAETCLLARNGQMNRFRPESNRAAAVEAPEAANRLQFWTSVGFPGDDAPGREKLHAFFGPLFIPGRLFNGAVRGSDAATALHDYDLELRARWPKIRDWIADGGQHVLWLDSAYAESFNPLPFLVEILGKCGAEYLGDWHAREGAA